MDLAISEPAIRYFFTTQDDVPDARVTVGSEQTSEHVARLAPVDRDRAPGFPIAHVEGLSETFTLC